MKIFAFYYFRTENDLVAQSLLKLWQQVRVVRRMDGRALSILLIEKTTAEENGHPFYSFFRFSSGFNVEIQYKEILICPAPFLYSWPSNA